MRWQLGLAALSGLQSLASARILSEQTTQLDDYDYVIVGSGPGGAPLAARLALEGHKVLVLEAGGDNGEDLEQTVPAWHLLASEHEPMRWDFYVNHYPTLEDQRKDSKMTYRKADGELYTGLEPPADAEPLGVLYPRSGTLGGCAAHNSLVTVYPHESDWNNLVSITGDDSWSADNMRDHFREMEKCRYYPSDILGHGYHGWFETSLTDITLLLEDPMLLAVVVCAATSMGKTVIGKILSTVTDTLKLLVGDLNSNYRSRDTSEDLFQVPIAVGKEKYTRSTPRSFLLEVANDPKYVLDIQLHTLVTKVQFDTSANKTPKATGVEFLRGESLYRADPRSANVAGGTPGSVKALKEVIISAGTFNSPQILMLSGIGPKADLRKAGVRVLVDSPGVGSNLQDHYETATVSVGEKNFTAIERCAWDPAAEEDGCLDRWQNNKILPGTYGTNGIPIAILKRTTVIEDGEPTDLVISGAPGNFRGYYPGFSLDAFAAPNFWSWIILKAHPGNRAGRVTLRSADPRDTPHINFNYYGSGDTDNGIAEKDLQAMYEGMKFARGILDNHIDGKNAFKEIWPGAEVSGEESVKEFLRNEAWGHHASCTVPIGADNDPNAVLDSKMRVRGVTGLRVVDASVMPIIPGTYTAMSTYLISEKAAKDILSQ